MNVLEYIDDELKKAEDGKFLAAQLAYNNYYNWCEQNNEDCKTYSYFRTKYNNAIKSMNNDYLLDKPAENYDLCKPKKDEPLPEKLKEKELELVSYEKVEELNLPGLIPTGTKFDELSSDRFTTDQELKDFKEKHGYEMPSEEIEKGGFTRKCADITAGPAGSGKTYLRCSLAALAKRHHRKLYGHLSDFKELKVSFISAEMRKSEWEKELKNCSLLKELKVAYVLDIVGQSNYESTIWDIVKDSDITIMDSFPAVVSHIKMNPSEKRTEKIIIFDLIRKVNEAVDQGNSNLQIINQANKDGNYKGGTELPHMLSSLAFVNLDGRRRYVEFNKNRNNGNVKKKLYIDKNEESNEIEFDVELYEATYNAKLDKQESLSSFLHNLNKEEEPVKKFLDVDGEDDIKNVDDGIVQQATNNQSDISDENTPF